MEAKYYVILDYRNKVYFDHIIQDVNICGWNEDIEHCAKFDSLDVALSYKKKIHEIMLIDLRIIQVHLKEI